MRAGDWKSAAFMCYMDREKLEMDTVAELCLGRSIDEDFAS